MSTPTQPPSKKAEDLLRELESIRALLQSAKSKHSAPGAQQTPSTPPAAPVDEAIDDDNIPVLGEDDDDVPLLLNDEDDDVPLLAEEEETRHAHNPLDDGMSLFDIANEGDDYPVFKTNTPQKSSGLNERVAPVREEDYAPLLTSYDEIELTPPKDTAPITEAPNPFLKRTERQVDIEDITGTAATSLPGTNSEAMALFDKLRASTVTMQAVIAPTPVSPDAVRAEANKLIEQMIAETMPKLEAELRQRLRAKFLK